MKKHSRVLALSVLLVFALAFACKKDENEATIDIITSKAWKLGLKDLNPSTNPPAPYTYHAVDSCRFDDTFVFKTDGKLLVTFGSKKCSLDSGNNKTFDYSFNKETKELVISGVKYTVVEENKTQFKYVQVVPATSGTSKMVYLLQ